MSQLNQRLRKNFKDKEYAHAYVDGFLNASIATQIKVLREERGWTQKKLAAEAGMEQSRISLLENVNYDKWSISTLLKLKEAFDITLTVSFDTFSEKIDDIAIFSRENLKKSPREDDLRPSTDTERESVASSNNVIPFPIEKLGRPDNVTLETLPAQVGGGEISKELYHG